METSTVIPRTGTFISEDFVNLSTDIVTSAVNLTTGVTSRSFSTYHYYGIAIVTVFTVFLTIFMVMSVLGNALVIITIIRHRGMRTRTNLLLGNLAIADILVALLDMPVAIVTLNKGDWVFSKAFCDFNGFTVGLGLMLSIHTLMWISIHKYISITRHFSRPLTPGKIVGMIVVAWIWVACYNLTPILGWTETVYKLGASQCGPCVPSNILQRSHSYTNTIVNFLIPVTVMFYCYSRIFREVRSHISRLRDFSDVSVRYTILQQKRISLTLFYVLACFLLCWFPYIIYSMALVFGGQESIPIIFNPIAYLFGYMNSACNPVIYALRSNSFRRSFQAIILGRTLSSTEKTKSWKQVVGSFTKSFKTKTMDFDGKGIPTFCHIPHSQNELEVLTTKDCQTTNGANAQHSFVTEKVCKNNYVSDMANISSECLDHLAMSAPVIRLSAALDAAQRLDDSESELVYKCSCESSGKVPSIHSSSYVDLLHVDIDTAVKHRSASTGAIDFKDGHSVFYDYKNINPNTRILCWQASIDGEPYFERKKCHHLRFPAQTECPVVLDECFDKKVGVHLNTEAPASPKLVISNLLTNMKRSFNDLIGTMPYESQILSTHL